jgi:hypothetical protein
MVCSFHPQKITPLPGYSFAHDPIAILSGSLPAAGNLPELQPESNEGMHTVREPDTDTEPDFFLESPMTFTTFFAKAWLLPQIFFESV